jgi:phosphatidylglycerophosphatase C
MTGRRNEGARRVAAFDLDGTLTRQDCVTPFLRLVAGRRLWLALARNAPGATVALVTRDRDRLKEIATTSLRGTPRAELDTLGRAFAETIVESRLRVDTPARLAWHRARGDVTVIVSASFEAYVQPLGVMLGVDDVLCTRLESSPEGILTGRLDGPNCRGAEKVHRLTGWLAARGLERAELWAYGDSKGDDELLALADHPVWVHGVTLSPNG